MHAAERWRSWQRRIRRCSRMCPKSAAVLHSFCAALPDPSPRLLPASHCRVQEGGRRGAAGHQVAASQGSGRGHGPWRRGGGGRHRPRDAAPWHGCRLGGRRRGAGRARHLAVCERNLPGPCALPQQQQHWLAGQRAGPRDQPAHQHAQRAAHAALASWHATRLLSRCGCWCGCWCGCRVACAWCEGSLRRHAAGAARNTTCATPPRAGLQITQWRAYLACSPCLPGAADYDAMVSKMTITELVALKQARSAQPSFAAHKSALRLGPAAYPAAASAAAAIRASGCRLRLTACSVQRRCREGGPSYLPPDDALPPVALPPYAGG